MRVVGIMTLVNENWPNLACKNVMKVADSASDNARKEQNR